MKQKGKTSEISFINKLIRGSWGRNIDSVNNVAWSTDLKLSFFQRFSFFCRILSLNFFSLPLLLRSFTFHACLFPLLLSTFFISAVSNSINWSSKWTIDFRIWTIDDRNSFVKLSSFCNQAMCIVPQYDVRLILSSDQI